MCRKVPDRTLSRHFWVGMMRFPRRFHLGTRCANQEDAPMKLDCWWADAATERAPRWGLGRSCDVWRQARHVATGRRCYLPCDFGSMFITTDSWLFRRSERMSLARYPYPRHAERVQRVKHLAGPRRLLVPLKERCRSTVPSVRRQRMMATRIVRQLLTEEIAGEEEFVIAASPHSITALWCTLAEQKPPSGIARDFPSEKVRSIGRKIANLPRGQSSKLDPRLHMTLKSGV